VRFPDGRAIFGVGDTLSGIIHSLVIKGDCKDWEAEELIWEQHRAVQDELKRQKAWKVLAELHRVRPERYIRIAIEKGIPEAAIALIQECDLSEFALQELMDASGGYPEIQATIQDKLKRIGGPSLQH
jgi:hypothetical protein